MEGREMNTIDEERERAEGRGARVKKGEIQRGVERRGDAKRSREKGRYKEK
jgi:hypothetical protein